MPARGPAADRGSAPQLPRRCTFPIYVHLRPTTVRYFTPCISRTVGLIRMASTTAAAMEGGDRAEQRRQRHGAVHRRSLPAGQLPMLVERNQMPIMKPAARSGASLVMALRPDRAQAQFAQRLQQVSPDQPARPDLRAAHYHVGGGDQDRKGQAGRTTGRARIWPGWMARPLRPIASQSQAKTGASAITKIGCTHWNQLAGKANPKMRQSVPRSANRLSEEPACSKAAQKSAEETNSTRMAAHRLRSTGDQLPKKISHEKTSTEIPSRHQPDAVGDHGGGEFDYAAHAERGQNRHHRSTDTQGANRVLPFAAIFLGVAGGGRMQARRAQMPAGQAGIGRVRRACRVRPRRSRGAS